MQRIGDRARGEIFRQCERFLEQRMLELQRVRPLGNAQLAEILARRAIGAHVIGGEEGKARVRSTGAVGIHGIARKLTEVRERQPE